MSKRRRNNFQKKHSASSFGKPVDVVISTGGRFDMLERCLGALRSQPVPVNIIVMDNATTDNEKRYLFEGTVGKRYEVSVGFPQANNDGTAFGNAPLILFLNDDCVLFPDAISELMKTMEDDTIGVCGAKLLFPPDSTSPIRPAGKVQHIGMALNIRGDAIHPLVGWSADHPKTSVSRDVFSITGACLMVRRSLFRLVGGFDVVFGMGTFEDVDLCLKVRSTGKRVFVNTNAKGYHYTGATSEKKQTPFPLQQNSMIFKNRWMGTPYMTWDEWSFY